MRPTSGPFNSRAKTLLGNDVCTYIVEPTTSGAPSWPRNVPVENVHAGRRFLTLSLVIWFNVLNRVAELSFPGITHCLSSVCRRRSSGFAYATAEVTTRTRPAIETLRRICPLLTPRPEPYHKTTERGGGSAPLDVKRGRSHVMMSPPLASLPETSARILGKAFSVVKAHWAKSSVFLGVGAEPGICCDSKGAHVRLACLLLARQGMGVWELAVFSYLMVAAGHPQQTLYYPTLEACEAARQAVLEIGQEERPNPVVGLCKRTERRSLGERAPTLKQ